MFPNTKYCYHGDEGSVVVVGREAGSTNGWSHILGHWSSWLVLLGLARRRCWRLRGVARWIVRSGPMYHTIPSLTRLYTSVHIVCMSYSQHVIFTTDSDKLLPERQNITRESTRKIRKSWDRNIHCLGSLFLLPFITSSTTPSHWYTGSIFEPLRFRFSL